MLQRMSRVLPVLFTMMLLFSGCRRSVPPPKSTGATDVLPESLLQIKKIAIPEGEPWDDKWVRVPQGQVIHVEVTATGAEQVSLDVARYPSGPSTTMEPVERKGNVSTFSISIGEVPPPYRLYLSLHAVATGEEGQTVRKSQLAFALEPGPPNFTTIALGTASGWASDKDTQVNELFKEGAVLWFDDAAKYATFTRQLRELLGVTIPTADLQGQSILAVLGAPTPGERHFEVFQLGKFDGPKNSAQRNSVTLDLLYSAKPLVAGPPTVAYHIIRADLSAYKRPGEVEVVVHFVPFPGGSFQKISIGP